MLVILLFFVPQILSNNNDDMKDIANKYFYDNWNVSLFQGFTQDIF